jgi:hypothetical protein
MMNYSVRSLKTGDIFKMSKIIKKLGLKVETTYKEVNEEGKEVVKTKTQEQIGTEVLMSVAENLHLAEEEVSDFLGGLAGLSGRQFSELPIDLTVQIMKQFKTLPGVSSFLQQAGQLTK